MFPQLIGPLMMKTPLQGGHTLVHAAISRDAVSDDRDASEGLYFDNGRAKRTSAFTSDVRNQEKLWRKTMEMLGMKDFFSEAQ